MQTIFDTGVFLLIWYKTVTSARVGRSNVKTLIVSHGMVYYRCGMDIVFILTIC